MLIRLLTLLALLAPALLPAPAVAQVIPSPRVLKRPIDDNSDYAASTAWVNTMLAGSKFGLSGVAPLNKLLANTSTNGQNTILFGIGNSISFCPQLSCLTSPTNDHQRTSALITATTQIDGQAEEQTLAVMTTINKGYSKPWTTSTAYSVGDNVQFPSRNSVYRVKTAGISASSGIGPEGTGSSIADGSVIWEWINAQAINGKVGIYNEVGVHPGAGQSWAQANNFEMRPGTLPRFMVNTEIDFTNHSGTDCEFGTNCIGLYMVMQGSNRSTTGISVTTTNQSSYSAYWGIRLDGKYLASIADIAIDSNAPAGIGFNLLDGVGGDGTHSTASIHDNSRGPRSLYVTGTHSIASIDDPSIAPVSLLVSGTKSIAGIYLNEASPTSIKIDGTRSSAAVNVTATSPAGFNLQGTHSIATILDTSTTPVSLSVGGTKSFAGIHLNETSPIALKIDGSRASAAVNVTTTSPAAFNLQGTHSIATVVDTATAPSALDLKGNYTAAINTSSSPTTIAMVLASGQRICFSPIDHCLVYSSGRLRYQVGGVTKASITDLGDLVLAGTVTANGSP